jgi:hypothetical protein
MIGQSHTPPPCPAIAPVGRWRGAYRHNGLDQVHAMAAERSLSEEVGRLSYAAP